MLIQPPPPPTPVDWDSVLDNISNGIVPSAFCVADDPTMPANPSEIERRAAKEQGFALQLETAKLMGAVVMLAECVTIADDKALKADQKKIQIDTRMKLAAIWNPACNPKTVIEQTTTHKTLTPREEYIDQMVSLMGFTKAEAAARYAVETGVTVQ